MTTRSYCKEFWRKVHLNSISVKSPHLNLLLAIGCQMKKRQTTSPRYPFKAKRYLSLARTKLQCRSSKRGHPFVGHPQLRSLVFAKATSWQSSHEDSLAARWSASCPQREMSERPLYFGGDLNDTGRAIKTDVAADSAADDFGLDCDAVCCKRSRRRACCPSDTVLVPSSNATCVRRQRALRPCAPPCAKCWTSPSSMSTASSAYFTNRRPASSHPGMRPGSPSFLRGKIACAIPPMRKSRSYNTMTMHEPIPLSR